MRFERKKLEKLHVLKKKNPAEQSQASAASGPHVNTGEYLNT
jgi:hypothetical protein